MKKKGQIRTKGTLSRWAILGTGLVFGLGLGGCGVTGLSIATGAVLGLLNGGLDNLTGDLTFIS